MLTRTARAGDVTVNGDITAAQINTARGGLTVNDVITFAAQSAVTMNAAVDLSGGAGGIVIDGSRQVTILDGAAGSIYARNVIMDNGACFVNNDSSGSLSTFVDISLGTNSVMYNNAALSQSLNKLTVTGDSSTLSGTAAMAFASQAAINGNFVLSGAGIKTFSGGVNVAAGKVMSITEGVHTFLGTTDIYGTVSTNSLAIDAINMGVVGGPATSSTVNIHAGGVVKTEGSGSWGLDMFKTSTVNISGELITTGGSSHAVVGQTDTGVKTLTVYNGGSITTGKSDDASAGATAYGIRYAGSGTSANKNIIDIQAGGSVTTYGVDAIGIVVGSHNDITIAGDVTTHGTDGVHGGADAHGVNVSSSNTINVSGNITTNGVGANGIRLSGTHDNIILSGKIETVDGVAIEGNTNNVITVASAGRIITGGSSRHGFYLTSNNNINHSGSISTAGTSSYGIYLRGDSNTINIKNGGSINTSGGGGAHAIRLDGASNTINVESGASIIATGGGYGILTNSGSNTINISGLVKTTSAATNPIRTVGTANITVTGTGRVESTMSGSNGIETSGDGTNITIQSGGVLSTAGDSAHGIIASSNAVIDISGTVSTTGASAYGMYLTTNNNRLTVENGGLIKTTSGNAHGILAAGTDNIITVEQGGSIHTGSHGICTIVSPDHFAEIGNNQVSIAGSVTTTGGGLGVYLSGQGNTATIASTGTISTTGTSAIGVYFKHGGGTATVSGSITTNGNEAHGIYADRTGSTITVKNVGSVKTTANNSYGIRTFGTTTNANVIGNVGAADNTITIEAGGSLATEGTSMNTDQATAVRVDSNADITIAGAVTTKGSAQSSTYGAFGINSAYNNKYTLTSTGSITTEGDHSDGITASGNGLFDISGSITTSGGDAHGVSSGAKNTVTLRTGGLITTSGAASDALRLGGTNTVTVAKGASLTASGRGSRALYLGATGNTVTLEGDGSTGATIASNHADDNTNEEAHSIYLTGAGTSANSAGLVGGGPLAGGASNILTVQNGATVTSRGQQSYGILSTGSNSKITLDGEIHTYGDTGIGIMFNGNNDVTLGSTGRITTEGTGSVAIYAHDPYNLIRMDGAILTKGAGSFGINTVDTVDNRGRNINITVGGSITTQGTDANAVNLGAIDNTLILSNGGSLTTTGTNAQGVYISKTGNNITIENSATITTSGSTANGIRVDGTGNTITMNGAITTNGPSARGIILNNTGNIVTAAGSITTNGGSSAHGIHSGFDNTNITLSGSIAATETGSYGILADSSNNVVRVQSGAQITTQKNNSYGVSITGTGSSYYAGGTITTSGVSSHGIALVDQTTMDFSGAVNTAGAGSHGIITDDQNGMAVFGTVSTTGTGAHGLFLEGGNNAAHISNSISSTGSSSYALASGKLSAGTGESNVFHILNGASLTGNLNNIDADNDATTYLTFGYVKNANKLADLTAVDDSFNLTLNGDIESASTGRWDTYFAGGTTTLAGTSNLRNMFIGAASFDGAAVPNGSGGTVNLNAIGGASATLNVSNNLNNYGTLNVGSGSTYNITGTHNQYNGGGVNIAGTTNITGAGRLNLNTSTVDLSGTINTTSSAALIIPTLDLSADSTITGSGSVSVTNALTLDHNLTLSGTQAVNLGTVNITEDKSIIDSDDTGLTGISALSVSSGKTGTLDGAGRISVNNADVDGSLVFSGSGTKMIYGTTALSGTITNNAGAATISTIDLDGDSTLSGSGNISVNNALTLDNNLALAGTNAVSITTVNITESKNITDSDNSGLTTINTLNLSAAKISTIGGVGAVTMTNVDIDTGGSLTLSGGAKTITNLTIAGTLTNNAAAMTITTLDLDGNSVLSGNQRITVSNQVVLDHDLTLSNSGGVLFSNGLDTSAGGTLVNNTVITSDGVVLIADGDTYVITGEHNFAGGSFSSSPTTGTLKLDGANAGGGIFNTTNTSSVNIAKLQVDGAKFGTISGTTAANITNGMTVAGTLVNSNTAGINSSGATNISGTYTINTKHTHSGSSDFTSTGTINLGGTLDIDGTGTNNIATLELTDDSTLDGDGNISVANALTLDHNLTLAGNGDTILGSVAINAGMALINNSGGGTQTIATLDVAGDDAELGGSGNTAVTNAVDIDNNFKLSGSGTKSFGTVNLNTAGKSITDSGSGATSINSLNVTANAALNDNDATAATSITTASVSVGNILTLGGVGSFNFGALNMSGGLTNNAVATITTFNQLADLTLDGTGTTTIVNSQTINANTLTLGGTGNTVFQGGLTIADGKKLTNNANAELATLTIANGHTATIEGTGVTTITNLGNIDGGATLVNIGKVSTAHTGTLGAAYQLNGLHTQTAGTLTVNNLDVTGNSAEIGGDGTVIIAGPLTVDNTLTLSGGGTRNFTGAVTLADGQKITANGAGTNNISSLDVAGGAGGSATIDGTGTITLGSATNIAGTLTNNGKISTAYDFNVATYNLGGIHYQTGGTFNVTTLDLTSDDSQLINNGEIVFSGNTNIIKNLALGGSGIKSFEGDVAVAAGKHLTLDGEGAKTIAGLVGLADGSSIISNGSGTTTVNAVTVAPGATGAIEGNGKTVVTGTTTSAAGTTLELNGSGEKTLADLDLGGTLNNNSPTTITDLDLTAAATIGGTGITTVTNQLELDNNLTLTGSGVKNLSGGVNMLDGNSLINSGTGQTNLASLEINSGSVTLDGTGPIVVSGTSNVETGETLNITGSGDKTLADVDLGGVLDIAAGASGTTNLANIDFANGGLLKNTSGGTVQVGTLGIASGITGLIQGTSTTKIQNANVAGTLIKTGTGDIDVTGAGFNVSGANGYVDMTAANSGNLNISDGATMTVSSTHDADGRGALNISGNLNVTGTLAVNSGSAITTSGELNTQADSTYNLSGTHNHVGTGDVNVAGKLDLAGGGAFLNKATGGTQTIADLSVSSGTGTLGGSRAVNVTTANIDGNLDFTATADTTFATTNLSGTLTQSSASNLNLTTLNIGSGKTGILAGTGTGTVTATDAFIASGGTFQLQRDMAVVNALQNSGTLALSSSDSVTLTGDYTQLSGGLFKVDVTSATVYGKLRVKGTADLTAGNGLEVVVTPNESLRCGDVLSGVLVADTLNAGTLEVTDNSALWKFTGIVNGNSIDLKTERGLKIDSAVESCPTVSTPATIGAAHALEEIMQGEASSDMEEVISQMSSLSTGDEVAEAVAQTVPIMTGAMAALGINMATEGATQVVNTRLHGMSGLSSGDMVIENRTLWAKPFYSHTEQEKRNHVDGFTASSYGIAMGLEADFTPKNRVGAALSYGRGNIRGYDSTTNHRVDSNTWQATAYAENGLPENFDINVIAAFGLNTNESSRNIQFGGLHRQAKADFNSWHFVLDTELLRNFAVTDRLTLAPILKTQFVYVNVDGYTETGAGDLSLKVDSSDEDSFIAALGAKANYVISDAHELNCFVDVGYDFLADQSSITAAYTGGGPAFITYGNTPEKVVYNGGVGYKFTMESGPEFAMNYQLEARETSQSHVGTMSFRLPF
ncbi:hypothetical protein D0S45_19190 [Marinifilum sp. JC120]|nr:hypothetical protein D0S45_19190 [Marinifilum sp. JC120]